MSTFQESIVQSRGSPRVSLQQSVAAVCRVAGHLRRSAGKTRDISRRGVFFYADFCLDIGTSVQLMLTFPADITYDQPMPVLCKGTIVRVERTSAAADF